MSAETADESRTAVASMRQRRLRPPLQKAKLYHYSEAGSADFTPFEVCGFSLRMVCARLEFALEAGGQMAKVASGEQEEKRSRPVVRSPACIAC